MKKKETSSVLFVPKEALFFIIECKKNNMAIIGIEGFIKIDKKILPQLEMIADFSNYKESNWVDYVEKCAKSAQKFINYFSKVPNVVFQFVVLDEK